MSRLIVDATTRETLLKAMQPVELYDQDGHLLGRFLPFLDPNQYEGTEPDITDDELERRRQDPRRYSTSEILRHLENL